MARALLHDGNTVVNVITYDPDSGWQAPDGLTMDPDPPKGISPRWKVNSDGTYDPPDPPEPTPPTRKEQANEKAVVVITDTPDANSIAALRTQVVALAEAVKLLTDNT